MTMPGMGQGMPMHPAAVPAAAEEIFGDDEARDEDVVDEPTDSTDADRIASGADPDDVLGPDDDPLPENRPGNW